MAGDENADDGDCDFRQTDVAFLNLLFTVGCVFDAADDGATQNVAASLKTQVAMQPSTLGLKTHRHLK